VQSPALAGFPSRGGSPPNLAARAVQKPQTGFSHLAGDRVDIPGMLSSTPSGAFGLPMSVRTHPGAMITKPLGSLAWRAAKLRISVLSAALFAR